MIAEISYMREVKIDSEDDIERRIPGLTMPSRRIKVVIKSATGCGVALFNLLNSNAGVSRYPGM